MGLGLENDGSGNVFGTEDFWYDSLQLSACVMVFNFVREIECVNNVRPASVLQVVQFVFERLDLFLQSRAWWCLLFCPQFLIRVPHFPRLGLLVPTAPFQF